MNKLKNLLFSPITFAALFLGYAFSRRLEVDIFNKSQLLLEQNHLFSDVILFFIHETTVIVLTAELDLMSD